jgi:hypothetical protein
MRIGDLSGDRISDSRVGVYRQQLNCHRREIGSQSALVAGGGTPYREPRNGVRSMTDLKVTAAFARIFRIVMKFRKRRRSKSALCETFNSLHCISRCQKLKSELTAIRDIHNRHGARARIGPEPVHRLLLHADFRSDIQPASGQVLASCYGATANPGFSAANAYCQRISRDATSGQISLLTSGLFNDSEFELAGVDTQVDYRFRVDAHGMPAKAGALQVGSVISYLNKYTVTPSDGTAATNYQGAISDTFVASDGENLHWHPRWKANSHLTYENSPFTATLRWRYIGPMANLDDPTQPVPPVSYFDADFHYAFSDMLTVSPGVSNLANKAPLSSARSS